MPVFKNTCPRHCYSSCSICSYINGNKLTRLLGDPAHGYSQGHLCAKGYALIQYAFDENRLKFPLKQSFRGSNRWQRIGWDEAFEIIAQKIFELNERYDSNLALGYMKGSGNQGFLHDAVQGMFAGLGPHTYPVGDICSSTGEAALLETIGKVENPDPEDIVNIKLLVLWGANPAITNVNQMKFIYQARHQGGKLVVIDPLFSKTAQRADIYIQLNVGSDAWLAWGVAKLLLENGQVDNEHLSQNTIGWEEYKASLQKISMREVCEQTGVDTQAIEDLAFLYAQSSPSASYIGFGLQRNRYGGQSVKAITALETIAQKGNDLSNKIYFRHNHFKDFPRSITLLKDNASTNNHNKGRPIGINSFAQQALALDDPPLKLLWVSCGNPFSQDQNFWAWEKLLKQLELVVTVDLYLTRTAQFSDLVLPASSFFEDEDLHISYWHYWLSFNQKILPVFYESKSDLQIARELTNTLNSHHPGFSFFPAEKTSRDWINAEITPEIQSLYQINDLKALIERPHKRATSEDQPAVKYKFPLPDKTLYNSKEVKEMDIPTFRYVSTQEDVFPYQLLTPQALLKFHTQYETLTWLNKDEQAIIEISKEIATSHKILDGAQIEAFNTNGYIRGRAVVNQYLPSNVICTEQSDRIPVNKLINKNSQKVSSISFNECWVNIRKARSYV